MPRVRRASGQEITIPADEVDDVRTLKRRIQSWCGLPRFRQRLLHQGCIFEDDAAVTDVELQLVLIPFTHASAEQEVELVDAADLGVVASVEAILQRPQNPDMLNEREHLLNTALGTASDRGHAEIVALLLEACADVDLYTLGVGPGYEGTSLTIAASRGHVEVVRLLLEAGASQETSGTFYGDEVTPLLAAIKAHSAWSHEKGPTDRHMETAQLLLQAHADLDFQGQTSSYWDLEYDARPLVAACQGGHVKAARLLLGHGFVDRAATPRPAASAIPHFAPALVAASSSGHVEIISLMLEAAGLGSSEAMPTRNRKRGLDTPLSAASLLGHVGMVRMLLEARAKDESAEPSGATALCLAAGEGHVEIVRLLLEAEQVHSG